MDLITGLVEEAKEMKTLPTPPPPAISSSSATITKSSSSSSSSSTSELMKSKDQSLLFIGHNDWDTPISNNPTGLDVYHRITFPKTTTSVKSVFTSSTSFHLFILTNDDSLYVMGKNDHGQLGNGDLISQKTPTKLNLDLTSKIIKIATGKSHSLLLLADGTVMGCGSNLFGQLGLGDSKTATKDFMKFTPIPFDNNNTTSIVDISAGENFSMVCSRSGQVFVFGHPEYGQLGLGSTGEYIKDGGKKGAAIQYNCVTRPRQILTFYAKDSHGKILETIPAERIKMRKVAAGKNHAMCLEDWEGGHQNRVFAWGFGGYGRLGHNVNTDELVPKEITFFNQSNANKLNPQKFIRDIQACTTFSLAGMCLCVVCLCVSCEMAYYYLIHII